MQFKELKIMRSAGHPDVQACVIVPVVHLPKGWQMCFGQDRDSLKLTMESQRGENRVFKTVDAAVKEARKIGYDRVEVFNP